MFERLFPVGEATSAEALLEEMPVRGVAINMVATIDGRASVGGGSTDLGGDGDHALFMALRRSVDAVLAGTGTVEAEDYGAVDNGRAALLMISRSGNVPWNARVFAEPGQRVGIAGPVAVPGTVRAQVTVVDETEPAAALAALRAALAVDTVLCEGGPTLNRSLLAAGVADELFLTVDPSVRAGEAPGIVAGEELVSRAELRWVLRHGDELLLRYRFRG